jgi:Fur family peroxide stress response transcriptional regulator
MMAHQKERLEEFVKICKEKRLKITPQRLAVYEILLRREDHPTVEEIYEEVKETYPFVSLATVYRTVETLEELGFIKRVAYWGSSDDHLVCVMCATILDLKAEAGCRVPEEVNGFKVSGRRELRRGYIRRLRSRWCSFDDTCHHRQQKQNHIGNKARPIQAWRKLRLFRLRSLPL